MIVTKASLSIIGLLRSAICGPFSRVAVNTFSIHAGAYITRAVIIDCGFWAAGQKLTTSHRNGTEYDSNSGDSTRNQGAAASIDR